MPHYYSSEHPLNPETPKSKQRDLRAGFPVPLTLRVHRALSWVLRSEAAGEDEDVRFIPLWIGFNAAYSGDVSLALGFESQRERDVFMRSFTTLVGLAFLHIRAADMTGLGKSIIA